MLSRRSLIGLIPLGMFYAAERGTVAAEQDGPEAIAKFGFEAFRSGKAAEFAAKISPESLAAMHQSWGELLSNADACGAGRLLHMFGVATIAQFRLLSAAELLPRLFAFVLGDHDLLAEYEFVALGSVAEKTDKVHVIYQLESRGGHRMPPQLVTLVQTPDGWMLGLLGEIAVSSLAPAGDPLEMPRTRVRVLGRIKLTDDTMVVCYRLWVVSGRTRLNKAVTARVKATDEGWQHKLAGDDRQLAAFINQNIRDAAQRQIDTMKSLITDAKTP
jgi:hypothetical protein